ncbi:MAG: sulfite exporter TauE/SafE family protein [Armatimonadota bacterium]|nr:sulfite exporter TauE/SafE family protein [Armatimonadota bacterium]MDR7438919.1 sulfite exporter TauE/SafE family protein [Armatimonadota bacterium]MDR7562459.1 sulfite exporter TauE/SafE family protein [Armatimonadota bacterium]MDR7567047.1 sulfite exporter TauE/SafE family protein [Armatimonadota bacterium]MDR7601172.1 sulfite exporter TauE/SafE family protein [Armatimonadota bacterium]
MLSFGLFVGGIFLVSAVAGLLGSLVGLGGGVLLIPLLTVGFGMDFRLAVGTSIVSVIATSSGAAAAYLRDRLTNLRVGVLLELCTTLGAISGALLAPRVRETVLFVLFGSLLLLSIVPTAAKLGEEIPQGVRNDALASWLRLASSYPDPATDSPVSYQVTRVPLGMLMMYGAGVASGLLGIGSGALKVLAMDTAMRLPLKVSTATSNFMIGVTAAASAGIYFWRGDIPPLVAAPVALGVLVGATAGARLLAHLTNRTVRWVFVPILGLVAVEMILRGIGGM